MSDAEVVESPPSTMRCRAQAGWARVAFPAGPSDGGGVEELSAIASADAASPHGRRSRNWPAYARMLRQAGALGESWRRWMAFLNLAIAEDSCRTLQSVCTSEDWRISAGGFGAGVKGEWLPTEEPGGPGSGARGGDIPDGELSHSSIPHPRPKPRTRK